MRVLSGLPSIAKTVNEIVAKALDPKSRESLAGMIAPTTPLNRSISSERSFAGVSISLPRAKALAKAAGGKLNDVVMAISSGVLRRYLLAEGALPAALADRRRADLAARGRRLGRQQPGVRHDLLARERRRRPASERLLTIIKESSKAKEMSSPLRPLIPHLSNIALLGAPMLVQMLALLYSRSNLSDVLPASANVTISNVPGPRQTLYAAGAELVAHLSGLDRHARARAQHHRAELSRPARLRPDRRRQRASPTSTSSRGCFRRNSRRWRPRSELRRRQRLLRRLRPRPRRQPGRRRRHKSGTDVWRRATSVCAGRHHEALPKRSRPYATAPLGHAAFASRRPRFPLSSPRRRRSIFPPHGPTTLGSRFRGNDTAGDSTKLQLALNIPSAGMLSSPRRSRKPHGPGGSLRPGEFKHSPGLVMTISSKRGVPEGYASAARTA